MEAARSALMAQSQERTAAWPSERSLQPLRRSALEVNADPDAAKRSFWADPLLRISFDTRFDQLDHQDLQGDDRWPDTNGDFELADIDRETHSKYKC
jgi:hypothetical protein